MTPSRNVAVLMNLSRPYDREVLRGISGYVREAGCHWRFYVEEEPADKIPDFTQWSGHGLIVDLDDYRLFRAMQGVTVPIVGIGRFGGCRRPNQRSCAVAPDDAMIGAWAANHLMECGFTHFAYCGIRQRGPDPWSQVRFDSFRQRLRERGFSCFQYTGRQISARHWTGMLRALADWLRGLPTPVGIMACNDWRARHVLEAARQLNRRVPEDIAVIGVDNDELTCDMADPPLSSIAPPTRELGYQAARLLDKLMSGDHRRPSDVVIPPASVRPRQSSDLFAVKEPMVHRAIRFIRDHAYESIGAPEAARAAGASRATLDNCFQRVLGRTVHAEIKRTRVLMAWDLLLATRLSLQDIAQRTGFRSAQYFCYAFRRETGKSPGMVRRHAANSPI
ncbi:MAG TPA: DNA-binding transcriptional regulator [Verrucomicrobiae bacterium]|nr:DNA-binding transcriptional regulator [Verrucomicrobiae bacterium]